MGKDEGCGEMSSVRFRSWRKLEVMIHMNTCKLLVAKLLLNEWRDEKKNCGCEYMRQGLLEEGTKLFSQLGSTCHFHSLIPPYSHILIFSYSHILIFSYSHILIFSYSHLLIFSSFFLVSSPGSTPPPRRTARPEPGATQRRPSGSGSGLRG